MENIVSWIILLVLFLPALAITRLPQKKWPGGEEVTPTWGESLQMCGIFVLWFIGPITVYVVWELLFT